jgi:hypothetical protein
MKYKITINLLLGALLFFSGCSSTTKRAGMIGGGAAAGAGVGALVGGEKNRALGAGVGAVAGAGLTALALGEDGEVYQRGLDDGYVLASSDAIKRHYWVKQGLEKGEAGDTGGALSYYVWEEQGIASDGRRLAPERVAVPVFNPTPVK